MIESVQFYIFFFPLLSSFSPCSCSSSPAAKLFTLLSWFISFWTAAAFDPMLCCQSSGPAPCRSFSPGALWHAQPCPHGSSGPWNGQSLSGPVSSAAALQIGSTSRAAPPAGGAGWCLPGWRAAAAGPSLRGSGGPTWWRPDTGTGGIGSSRAEWGTSSAAQYLWWRPMGWRRCSWAEGWSAAPA